VDFRRGLQTSGLVYQDGVLWAVGDQRGEHPASFFRIDPATARLLGPPVRIDASLSPIREESEFEAYRAIPNPDFEGLSTVPGEPETLLAVTEAKTPWLVELRLLPQAADSPPRVRAMHIRPLDLPKGLAPWRGDANFRFEGLAVSPNARSIYLAFERDEANLPRLYRTDTAGFRAGKAPVLEEIPLPFDRVPRRPDKDKALLNLNDLLALPREGRCELLALARDQERILVLDPERRTIERIVDLDLLDPEGRAIEWVSPEGMAAEPAGDALWLINDPDSERGNFRRRSEVAEGRFAEYAPLLFRLRLSEVLGKAAASPEPRADESGGR
jgi:hypothetical protein